MSSIHLPFGDVKFEYQGHQVVNRQERFNFLKLVLDARGIASGAAAAGAVDMGEFREKMTPFTVQPEMVPDPFDAMPPDNNPDMPVDNPDNNPDGNMPQ